MQHRQGSNPVLSQRLSALAALPKARNSTQVLGRLNTLQAALLGSSFEALVIFNQTYIYVTQMTAALEKPQAASEPEVLARLDGVFFAHYAGELTRYAKGRSVSPAWLAVFNACRAPHPRRLMILTLAANAHINNDLALSLHEAGCTQTFAGDFAAVGAGIKQSLPQIIQDGRFSLGYLDTITLPLINWLISRWRAQAWRQFELLQNGTMTSDQIEQAAARKAQRIMRFPWPM